MLITADTTNIWLTLFLNLFCVSLHTGLSIHRIKRDDASDESYFREVQTLKMELQQIMKGACFPILNIKLKIKIFIFIFKIIRLLSYYLLISYFNKTLDKGKYLVCEKNSHDYYCSDKFTVKYCLVTSWL